MSERTTGATPEQIEAAVKRRFDEEAAKRRFGETAWVDEAKLAYRDIWTNDARYYASKLVPPDHRIIGPDDIAALRRLIELQIHTWDSIAPGGDIAHLAALIGYEL